ncbi:MAG: molybdenum cofactor guanylyltransferase [Bacteroidetes bacterium]|nr:molybdenum cofactor guanylyltransferase [Bacteroidota bacterium]
MIPLNDQPHEIAQSAIGAIILSGGKSSRMGSEKGLVEFNGKPMIQWAIECIRPLTDEILIVANDAAYGQFGYPLQEDEAKGDGPLSGLVSGIRHAKTDLNFLLPCDMPLMDNRLLEWMLETYDEEAAAVCTFEDHLQPLVGMYHRKCLPTLERLLARNQLKMRIALEELQAAVLDPQRSLAGFHPDWMRNFNSKAEINLYLQGK